MFIASNNLYFTTICFLIISFLVSCNSNKMEKMESQQNVEWKSLTQDGYSLSFPENWKLDISGKSGTSFLLYAPTVGASVGFKTNINMIKRPLNDDRIDLATYAKGAEQQIQKADPEKIVVNTGGSANGKDYHKIIYTAKKQGYDLVFHQQFWVENATSYVLTMTALADDYTRIKDDVAKIMDGFQITGI